MTTWTVTNRTTRRHEPSGTVLVKDPHTRSCWLVEDGPVLDSLATACHDSLTAAKGAVEDAWRARSGRDTNTRRAIIYARVSTAEQAASGLGIGAQFERCRAYATARGIEAREVSENGVSGTMAPADRPVLGPVLAELAAGIADTLIVAKLDRLGRDVRDVLALAEVAQRQGWSLVVLDLDIDTSTAGGKLVLTMFAALAEWERNVIAERTRAALAEKKRQGARLGRPVEVARETAERIRELRAGGSTLQGIADSLNESGMRTPRGAAWKRAGIARVLRSLDLDAQASAAGAGQ